ncbi:hypothetical protein [Clostridium novyi]|uniref:hypothetical protein n=1 Tax=Clostridium novyi TaxID=1542 RepID=UPI0004D547CA|nr:hypothetical protein [Clostridium novyi]KEH84706.1 hypothetical protein Z965_p0009 [Clostridium novyi A str. BKT29909]
MKKQQTVLEMLSKLKELNDDSLENVNKVVDACLVVQTLSNMSLKADKLITQIR